MVILNDICVKCICVCNSIHFQQNFKNWTSGNDNINKLIQSTQLLAHNELSDALEWIPYDRFHDISKYIAESEFNNFYRAKWIDGHILRQSSRYRNNWDDDSQDWKRDKPNIQVVLKILNNPKSITLEYIDKV
jgi:hypothetical protein